MKKLEELFETLLFSTRWLLAPIYFGLSFAVLALGIKFFQEIIHVFSHINELKETDLVLTTLSLIDITLVGSLIVMVMFSGYENFVSKIDVDAGNDKLDWLGKLDANTLKLKVAASIVAISSIHLLRKYMEIPSIYEEHELDIAHSKLMWYTIIHMAFVVSALMLAYLDKIAFAAHRDH